MAIDSRDDLEEGEQEEYQAESLQGVVGRDGTDQDLWHRYWMRDFSLEYALSVQC